MDRRQQKRAELDAALKAREAQPPSFLGHPMLPIALRDNHSRTERVSTYVELSFRKFLAEYAARGGFRGESEVLRRLAILGAQSEGYQFDEQGDKPK